jgi:hypothetical protein
VGTSCGGISRHYKTGGALVVADAMPYLAWSDGCSTSTYEVLYAIVEDQAFKIA